MYREPHIACCTTIPQPEEHSWHPITILSGSLLRVTFGCSCSENSPQGDMFHKHGGHQIKCDGLTPEDSKRSLPLTSNNGRINWASLRVWARVMLWRWLGKRCCYVLPLQSNATIPGTFWLPIIFSSLSLLVLMQSGFLSQPSCCTVFHTQLALVPWRWNQHNLQNIG
jgi:hypothetical protein